MPEKQAGGNTGVVPWTAVIAVLFATTGAIFYFSPLKSARPDTGSDPRIPTLGEQDASARLWQDPFRAASDRRQLLHEIPPSSPFAWPRPRSDNSAHPLDGLKSQIEQRLTVAGESNPVLILPVMVPAGAYAELVEQRLRLRVAILEAIGLCGYQPADGEHIGYVETPWLWKRMSPADSDSSQRIYAATADSSNDQPLVLPYEWCEVTPVKMAGTTAQMLPRYNSILVLWVDEDALGDMPLARLAAVLRVRPTPRPDVKWKRELATAVIGPRVSTTYHAILAEAASKPRCLVTDALRDARMYAATPTAEDRLLLLGIDNSLTSDTNPVERMMAQRMAPTRGASLRISRTTLTDDDLCRAIVAELDRRGINVRSRNESAVDPVDVAVIAEWDTYYGRALPISFAAAASGIDVLELAEGKASFPPWIHPFVYLRGIDGKIAGVEKPKSAEPPKGYDPQSSPNQGTLKTQTPSEPPEGLNQSDYLRRLADQLADLDAALRGQGKRGLRAVGVLGTDVYDTLLVLRALHDRLPDALFFTTGMDARYSSPDEWSATHNLVTVAPFGLRLHRYFQHNIPPFRDSYQTAVFLAAQIALGTFHAVAPDKDPHAALSTPRIFEIGRSGPFDLSVDAAANLDSEGPSREYNIEQAPATGLPIPPTIHPPRYDLATWPPRWIPWFKIAAVLMLLLLIPLLFTLERRQIERFKTFVRAGWSIDHRTTFWKGMRHGTCELAANTPFAVLLAIASAATIIYLFLALSRIEGQPLAPFDRVSVWPTEFVRLFAALLALHLLIKARAKTHQSDLEIQRDFVLSPLSQASGRPHPGEKGVMELEDRKPSWGISKWKVLGDENGHPVRDPKRLSGVFVLAQNLWWEYLRHGSFRRRLLRSLVMAALFYLFAFALSETLVIAPKPLRGTPMNVLDYLCARASFILFIWLTFYVIDGAIVNCRFIGHLAKRTTYYPLGAFEQFKNFGLRAHDLTEYADIKLIATRTRVVGEFVYYPFLIFFLIVMARSSLFADWKWHGSSIFILALCLSIAIFGMLYLRSAAERARREAMARLRARIIENRHDEPKAKALSQIYDLVEAEKTGAFSLLSNHPFIYALLMPSGSIGLWAILEYLARHPQG